MTLSPTWSWKHPEDVTNISLKQISGMFISNNLEFCVKNWTLSLVLVWLSWLSSRKFWEHFVILWLPLQIWKESFEIIPFHDIFEVQLRSNVKKGDNGRNLSDMKINWETAFNSVTELTDSVLSKTQAALGPYLSIAFGYVKMPFKNWKIIMI